MSSFWFARYWGLSVLKLEQLVTCLLLQLHWPHELCSALGTLDVFLPWLTHSFWTSFSLNFFIWLVSILQLSVASWAFLLSTSLAPRSPMQTWAPRTVPALKCSERKQPGLVFGKQNLRFFFFLNTFYFDVFFKFPLMSFSNDVLSFIPQNRQEILH